MTEILTMIHRKRLRTLAKSKEKNARYSVNRMFVDRFEFGLTVRCERMKEYQMKTKRKIKNEIFQGKRLLVRSRFVMIMP